MTQPVRAEDNQKLAREALPHTALHPMGGKASDLTSWLSSHGARRGTRREAWGKQAALATEQATLLLYAALCSHCVPEAYQLLLVVGKK